MRVFSATFYCETNSFSPLPCGWTSFREQMLDRPGEHPDQLHEVTAPLWALRRRAESRGWTIIEGTCAYAKPAAPVQAQVYQAIRDEILGQLRAAGPVDAVVLSMHGAMMAQGVEDCEGDLAARVRAIVDPDTPVGMLLDPHCHLSVAKLDNCDIVILLKEAPHTDFLARSEELLDLIEAKAAKRIEPVKSVFDCRMVDLVVTTLEPGRSLVDEMVALEKTPGVLSISLAHGMELGDSPDMGTRVLVITDRLPDLGARLAEQIGRKVFSLRGRLSPHFLTREEGIEAAVSARAHPVILADSSDNAGAGAASDSTFLLADLIARGERGVCAGPIWDPVAVRLAFEAGVGGRLAMRVGGKLGPESGDPLDLDAEIIGLAEDGYQTWAGSKLACGNVAGIRCSNGIDIVLNDKRTQAFGTDLFTQVGVDPAKARIIIVKSTLAFLESFGPIAGEVHLVAGPGSGASDPRVRQYARIPSPIWPLDEAPFG